MFDIRSQLLPVALSGRVFLSGAVSLAVCSMLEVGLRACVCIFCSWWFVWVSVPIHHCLWQRTSLVVFWSTVISGCERFSGL